MGIEPNPEPAHRHSFSRLCENDQICVCITWVGQSLWCIGVGLALPCLAWPDTDTNTIPEIAGLLGVIAVIGYLISFARARVG
jgi:hypothetical protein